MGARRPTNVISRTTVTAVLDATDVLVDRHGPAALDVPAVAAHLGWHTGRVYRYFTTPADLATGLIARDRGTYAFRLYAAGLHPAVVTWLLDTDPVTVLGLARALDQATPVDDDEPIAYTVRSS